MTVISQAGVASRAAHKKLDPHKVTVTRGSLSFPATATIGETRSEEILTNNVVILTRVRNYLIDVVEYNFGEGCVEPEVGDQITEGETVWIVTEDSTDTAWRWSDRERKVYRLNTVESSR